MNVRKGRLAAVTAGAVVALMGAQPAFADVIDNNLTISSKAGFTGNDLGVVHPPDGVGAYYEVLAVPAGGTAVLNVELVDTSPAGCVASSGSPLVMAIARSAAAPSTVDDLITGVRTNLGNAAITYAAAGSLASAPATVTFTGCGVQQGLTISAPAPLNYLTRFTFTTSDSRCATGSTCALTGRFAAVSVPSNMPPVVDAGPALTGTEGSPTAIPDSGASDPDSDPLAYEWTSAGDAGNDAGADCVFDDPQALHPGVTCDDDGVWTLTLEADDGVNPPVTDTVTLTVSNANPTVGASTVGSTDEGSPVTVIVTPGDPGANDVLTTELDCDNDTTYETTAGTCTFPDDTGGPFTIGVRVSDDDGGSATTTTSATVVNVSPAVTSAAFTATSAPCPAVGATSNATLAVSFTDPGADTWAAAVDWDYDGVTFDSDTTTNPTSAGSFTVNHLYTTAGLHTAAVRVTDDDLGSSGVVTSTNTFRVLYAMSGILSPFNADGSSVWKYGSTVPVKVRITDCAGTPVPGLTVRVGTSLINTSNPTVGIDEAASTSSADTGTLMRYDAGAGQYVYNLNTKGSILTPDGSASYWMYVRQAESAGRSPAGVVTEGQSWQRFGLRLK